MNELKKAIEEVIEDRDSHGVSYDDVLAESVDHLREVYLAVKERL